MQPYQQGFNACTEGKAIEDNPYANGNRDYTDWLDGYQDAANEEDEEQDPDLGASNFYYPFG